jgi:hypothetical protein
MRSTSSGFTFSITTVAAVALIVACSPNNGKVTIGARPVNGSQQKVTSCTDSIRASEKLKIGAKNKVVICEIPDGQSTSVPVTYPVSFSVQKSDSATSKSEVSLSMTIGLQPSVTLDDKARADLLADFKNVCGTATENIFTRSRVGSTTLKMNLEFVLADSGDVFGQPATSADHVLFLSKSTSGADASWALNQFPTKPSFFPKGRASDLKDCNAKFSSSKEQVECAWAKRLEANAPACAAFAKRVGNLVGIVDAEKEASTCGAVQPVEEKLLPAPTATPLVTDVAKPQPTNPNDSSTFSKPRMSDSDFISKAELNRKDLLTILAPVCPDQIKDAK